MVSVLAADHIRGRPVHVICPGDWERNVATTLERDQASSIVSTNGKLKQLAIVEMGLRHEEILISERERP
jgi:hypothetical protein